MLIISSTNRKDSYSFQVSLKVESICKSRGIQTQILDLSKLPFAELSPDSYKAPPSSFEKFFEQIQQAQAFVFVCPEYNGSLPGILKYFIDISDIEAFAYKRACLIGLGEGFSGGLRALDHLQSILSYLKMEIFPSKTYIPRVSTVMDAGSIKDKEIKKRLENQLNHFFDSLLK